MHSEETGKVCNKRYVCSGMFQNQCIGMVNVHDLVYESRHSPWGRFLKQFGNLQEHKIREHRDCVQHHSKTNKQHSQEILNVKTLDYQSPSWTRSTLFNDNLINSVTAKVCVYADSVLCTCKIEHNPGAADAKWTGQIEDLKRYSSYQDAVGFDEQESA